jgi:A/G-specific adenine glycosylase
MCANKKLSAKFPVLLMEWNRKKNTRKMPWKGEKDPYKIWLSEIILQQTRVEQGLGYYEKFIAQFPTIHGLAKAKDERIYKLWEGLGYYSRCKNLIETARFISLVKKGKFPDTFDEIIALKGVGSYTASAISSFAYNLPYAVVDGNVFRVLSRVFGIEKPIDSTEGKKYFSHLAFELLDKKQPGIYNQALMDFGAVVCKPANPNCFTCPIKKYCFAFNNDDVDKLPIKEKRLKIKTRWFNYLILKHEQKIYIRKREENDIWRNLFEYVLIETEKKSAVRSILTKAEKRGLIGKGSYQLQAVSPIYAQLLSHQKIMGQFIELQLQDPPTLKGLKAISPKQLSRYPFPKLLNIYFEKTAVPQ